MRELTSLTDDQIIARFEDLCYGPMISNLTFTRDTIEDFKAARKDYSDIGKLYTDKAGVLEINGVQSAKGQPRKNLVVIDLGEIRAVYFL